MIYVISQNGNSWVTECLAFSQKSFYHFFILENSGGFCKKFRNKNFPHLGHIKDGAIFSCHQYQLACNFVIMISHLWCAVFHFYQETKCLSDLRRVPQGGVARWSHKCFSTHKKKVFSRKQSCRVSQNVSQPPTKTNKFLLTIPCVHSNVDKKKGKEWQPSL